MKDIIVRGKIEFSEEKEKQYNREFEATLADTPATAYGNKTCVLINFNDRKYEDLFFDTRYDKTIRKTIEGLKEWLLKFFKQNYKENKITFLN